MEKWDLIAVSLLALAIYTAVIVVNVGFSRRRYSVEEGSATEVCVSFFPSTMYYTVVNLVVYSDDAYNARHLAKLGEDYEPVFERVVLSPDVQEVCFSVYTFEDYSLEGEETFALNLYCDQVTNVVVENVEISVSTTYITITDNEVAKVGFQYSSYFTSEDEGTVDVCLELIKCPHDITIYRPIQIKIYTADGSAIVGEDYERVLELVTFDIGDSYYDRQCVTVYIISDDVPEPEEAFYLRAYSSDVQVYIPDGRQNAYVTIAADGAVTCSELLPLVNGSVVMDGDVPGSTATYDCDDTFALVGPQIRVCQDNGEWSGVEPQCIFFEIRLDDDTPAVNGRELRVSFSSSVPLESAFCQLSVSNSSDEDCTSGEVVFNDLPVGFREEITLSIWAIAPINETLHITRQFRTDTSGVCSAHQINEVYCNDTAGLKVIEFQGTGPDGPDNRVDTFQCTVRRVGTVAGPEACTSPHTIDTAALPPGKYVLRIRPDPNRENGDCDRRNAVSIPFSLE